jgi:hypothetical protein
MLGALSTQSTEVLIQPDAAAWRLHARGWIPLYARMKLDVRGDVFPVGEPNLQDLEQFMWALDAPYEARRTSEGSVEIAATGRGANAVWEWLTELIEANRGL